MAGLPEKRLKKANHYDLLRLSWQCRNAMEDLLYFLRELHDDVLPETELMMDERVDVDLNVEPIQYARRRLLFLLENVERIDVGMSWSEDSMYDPDEEDHDDDEDEADAIHDDEEW